MIDLDKIFMMQKDLANYIKNTTSNPPFWDESKAPFEHYKKFMLGFALLTEVIEYMCETKFKWWKNPENYKIDDVNRKEVEVPDMLHFFIQICIEEGVTPEFLMQKYTEKWQENHRRQDTKY